MTPGLSRNVPLRMDRAVRVAIHYGQEHLEIEVPEKNLVHSQRGAAAPAITDVSAAVRTMLEQPLEFPPLPRALTPDDHVAVVVTEDLSHLPELLAPVQEMLTDAGIDPHRITLLGPPRAGEGRPPWWQAALPATFQQIAFEVHDPADRKRISYLASTGAGRRIYLNRTLVDAEQVIVIGRAVYDPVLGYAGGVSDLFPRLSDEATRYDFSCHPSASIPNAHARPARQEADEVGWLLGMPFVLQAIEGQGDEILHVLAGAAGAVSAEARRLLDQRWRVLVDEPADLVIASVSGDPRRQGFGDLTRALASSARVVKPGGRIVLLCQIKANLGATTELLRQVENPVEGLARARQVKSPDALNLWELATAAEQAQLYLHSDIPADVVEDLFVTPLARASQVNRLVEAGGSCLILEDAHRVLATLRDASDTQPRTWSRRLQPASACGTRSLKAPKGCGYKAGSVWDSY